MAQTKETQNRRADNGRDDIGAARERKPRAMAKCIYIACMVGISPIVLCMQTKTSEGMGSTFREMRVTPYGCICKDTSRFSFKLKGCQSGMGYLLLEFKDIDIFRQMQSVLIINE